MSWLPVFVVVEFFAGEKFVFGPEARSFVLRLDIRHAGIGVHAPIQVLGSPSILLVVYVTVYINDLLEFEGFVSGRVVVVAV